MKLEVIDSKEEFRALCERESTIPLFSRAWWLDAVAGSNHWNAVLAVRGEEIVGALPYVRKQRWGRTILTQPLLTRALGPWVRPSQAKYVKALTVEKDILGTLADGLPPFAAYRQNWDCARGNWLPFYWRGFQQTTRYTYRIPKLNDEKLLWTQCSENIRREIRKAQNRFSLNIRNDLSVQEFLDLNEKTFARQGMKLPYSRKFVTRLDTACRERSARKIFIAEDSEGRRHAGVYTVWDENSAYYLMGGSEPTLRNSGAMSFCMWEAIRFSATVTKNFDFEGSMLEPVERFFRAFGAIQTPYFSIEKTPSRLIRLRNSMVNLLR